MKIKTIEECFPKLKKPIIIAGPCSAETEDQVMQTAREIKEIPNVQIFRAGIWKPRTRPNSFEGVGEKGLPWLQRVKEETGLQTAIEIANAKHVELALKYGIDILWIGARTTVSPFAVQEIADALKGTDIRVMIKNPLNADLSLWLGAIERIHQAGIDRIIAIHRGFSIEGTHKYRNAPVWKIPIELKQRVPNLPMICDPSHIAGKRALIANITQKALDIDMDGAIIETHITPETAWSDAAQQVTPTELKKILGNLSYRSQSCHDKEFENELEVLRDQIDRADQELIELLAQRQNIVADIARAKLKNNVTALQVTRVNEMMKKRFEKGESVGLSREYIKEIYDTIHTKSVKTQINIMEEKKDEENK